MPQAVLHAAIVLVLILARADQFCGWGVVPVVRIDTFLGFLIPIQGKREVNVRRTRQAHHLSQQTEKYANRPWHGRAQRLESVSPRWARRYAVGEETVLKREGCDLL